MPSSACYFLSLSFIFCASAHNIKYSVIAESLDGYSVSVVVDDQSFPLSPNGILYQGDAPVAHSKYHYSLSTPNGIISEQFQRDPSSENTVHEFFNRKKNNYHITPMPQILPPLTALQSIKSDLHRIEQIPSVHMFGDQEEIDVLHNNQTEELEANLSVSHISLDDQFTFHNVKVTLSGRSSRWVPKLSYTLKLNKESLYGYRKIKLRAMDIDTSHIRECLSYSALQSVGVPTTGFSYVRLFINGKAIGFYGIMESFDNTWLRAKFADADRHYKPGYLYQGNAFPPGGYDINFIADLSYHFGDYEAYGAGQYKVKGGPEKKTLEDYEELDKFALFINETNVNTSLEKWNNHLDVDGFLRSMAMEFTMGFCDAYMSLANNYFIYQDPDQNNRIIYFGADMDLNLGMLFFRKDMMLAGDYREHPGFSRRPLTRKLFLSDEVHAMFKELILTIVKELVNPDIMYPYIDSIVDMIRPDVKWDETLPRVGSLIMPGQSDATSFSLAYNFTKDNPGIEFSAIMTPTSFETIIDTHFPDDVNLVSIKDFIAIKSDAILAFFHQN
ncbi:coth protein-domain-containing protein [Pilobolus umbonatus]|nr:coth protein-domain-containing protein [Pilobolus umbonatus]